MSYFIIAFVIWVVGKILFRYPKELMDNPGVIGVGIVVIFFISLLTRSFISQISNDEKENVKKVTLTVTNRTEHGHELYLRFSDGYTQIALIPQSRGYSATQEDKKWFVVQKGDKVQKLIYSNGKCKYTPVFDE